MQKFRENDDDRKIIIEDISSDEDKKTKLNSNIKLSQQNEYKIQTSLKNRMLLRKSTITEKTDKKFEKNNDRLIQKSEYGMDNSIIYNNPA